MSNLPTLDSEISDTIFGSNLTRHNDAVDLLATCSTCCFCHYATWSAGSC